MNNKDNSVATRSNVGGVIAFAGAGVCAIALFTIVSYASKAESPFSVLLFFRSMTFVLAFILIGSGVFTDKPQRAKVGLIVGAIGFILCAFFPIMWISETAKLYDSLNEGLGGGNGILLLSYIAAFIGFILMGSVISNESKVQSSTKSIAIVMIAVYLVITFFYTFWDIDDLGVTLREYLTYYIDGSGALAIVGTISVLFLPSAFPNVVQKPAQYSSITSTTKPIMTPVVENTTNNKPSSDNSVEDAVEMVRKYKELLDMGIITAEEFQEKKSKLLDL